ncbi:MAG: hypothetical protein ABR616_04445, partial [Dermatophilaceae bacterium]
MSDENVSDRPLIASPMENRLPASAPATAKVRAPCLKNPHSHWRLPSPGADGNDGHANSEPTTRRPPISAQAAAQAIAVLAMALSKRARRIGGLRAMSLGHLTDYK